jgi:hypothetical protein
MGDNVLATVVEAIIVEESFVGDEMKVFAPAFVRGMG